MRRVQDTKSAGRAGTGGPRDPGLNSDTRHASAPQPEASMIAPFGIIPVEDGFEVSGSERNSGREPVRVTAYTVM